MYPLAELNQHNRIPGLYPMSAPWRSCFFIASLWLWQFIYGDHKLEVFATYLLWV